MIKVQLAWPAFAAALALGGNALAGGPDIWRMEWPNTDFSQSSVDFREIISGGPPKDGIPAIDAPRFTVASDPNLGLSDDEPVIACVYEGAGHAYPLRILMFHEIVNDVIGDLAIAVTYCPLCNTSIVFDRTVDGRVLDFGTTGKLRFSDLVMYDRQTESWWQQFTGEAIVGAMNGKRLAILPSRVMPFGAFRQTFPEGRVLQPPERASRYGVNPYVGYDTAAWPFLFDGDYDSALAPLEYVLAVGSQAWSLDLLQRERRIETAEFAIEWRPGMASALDERWIPDSRDIGHISVTAADGSLVPHILTFAFAFEAFNPDGVLNH